MNDHGHSIYVPTETENHPCTHRQNTKQQTETKEQEKPKQQQKIVLFPQVSGDNPVYVESVKPGGAAQKAGLMEGDMILKVN